MKIEEYFSLSRAGTAPKQCVLWARIGNQLGRGGILTMRQLCEMPAERIARVRGIGKKSLAIILEEREKYLRG